MALPFLAGLAVGAGVVVALSKSETIKKTACSFFKKTKDVANDSFEKSKETVEDVKLTIDATALCIKEKKAALAKQSNEDKEKKDDA